MFRDRVVSMEQTFEGGEKHLPLLKDICREALPEFVFREHVLDHERDLFVMDFDAPDGSRRRVCWTRMVLFDAERIPTLAADPAAALRAKIVALLREQAARPEILVSFRHLEDGWVDTPEPRRSEGRRRRRGGRGGRGADRPGAGGRPGGPRERERDRRPGGGPQGAPAQPQRGPAQPQRGPGPQRPAPDRRPAPPVAGAEVGAAAPGGKRRRRRRRRGGRGPGGAVPGPGAAPSPQGPKP
jgi:hypothetical protein